MERDCRAIYLEERIDEKERNFYRSVRKGSGCSRKRRERRGSAEYLFSYFKNYEVENSYLEECNEQEEGNFQACFHNFFNLNKSKQIEEDEDEDHLELNNLMFITSMNIHNSSESTTNEKYDVMSLVDQEMNNPPHYLTKKRQLFQVTNTKNGKKVDKTVKKKLRFLTYNTAFAKK